MINKTNTSHLVAKILLDINAITINAQKPFKYTSGMLSPVYSDLRLLISYPKYREKVVTLLVDLIKRIGAPDVIAGTATAGIPHAAWVSKQLNLPMIYVRGKPKEHGKQNQVEGLLKKDQKTVIIEDLISTAKSSLESMRAIKESGGKVTTIVAIYNYMLPQASENLKQARAKLYTLTTFPIVVETAITHGRMKEHDKEIVLAWLHDPAGWGKKMGFEK